jgi:hypothetical protein
MNERRKWVKILSCSGEGSFDRGYVRHEIRWMDSGVCRDTRDDHGQCNEDAPAPLVPNDLSPRGGPTTTTVSRSCRGDTASFPWAYNTRGLGHGYRRLISQSDLWRES